MARNPRTAARTTTAARTAAAQPAPVAPAPMPVTALIPVSGEVFNRTPATTGSFQTNQVGLDMNLSIDDLVRVSVSKARKAANQQLTAANNVLRGIDAQITANMNTLRDAVNTIVRSQADKRRAAFVSAVNAFLGNPINLTNVEAVNAPHGIEWDVNIDPISVGDVSVNVFQVRASIDVSGPGGSWSAPLVTDIQANNQLAGAGLTSDPITVYNAIVTLRAQRRNAATVVEQCNRSLQYIELELADAVRDNFTASLIARAAQENEALRVFETNLSTLLAGTEAANVIPMLT